MPVSISQGHFWIFWIALPQETISFLRWRRYKPPPITLKWVFFPPCVGLNIHAFFYWNDSCVAVTLGPHSSLFKCISKNSANQTIKLAISLHSHQLGNQQRACFPNEPLAALILETVPIKLVTRHHPKHKNHWDSRSLLGFFCIFLVRPVLFSVSLHIWLSLFLLKCFP